MMEHVAVLLTIFGQRTKNPVNVNPTFTLQMLEHAQVVQQTLLTRVLIRPMMEPAAVVLTMFGPQKTKLVNVNPTFTLQILEHVIAVKQAQLT
jgi:hypothetical protein